MRTFKQCRIFNTLGALAPEFWRQKLTCLEELTMVALDLPTKWVNMQFMGPPAVVCCLPDASHHTRGKSALQIDSWGVNLSPQYDIRSVLR